MGSSYFGEPNMMRNNERVNGLSSSSSSSSSRKGKKNGSEKPKQPQRGLGVAQLEKIRLHAQMASAYNNPPLPSSSFNHEDPRVQAVYSSIPSSSSSSYVTSYGFQPNVVMGVPEYERTNIGHDSRPRWHHPNSLFETQQPLAQPHVTRPFLNLYDSHHNRSGSVGSSSQNSESSEHQELDLELRLSI